MNIPLLASFRDRKTTVSAVRMINNTVCFARQAFSDEGRIDFSVSKIYAFQISKIAEQITSLKTNYVNKKLLYYK